MSPVTAAVVALEDKVSYLSWRCEQLLRANDVPATARVYLPVLQQATAELVQLTARLDDVLRVQRGLS